MFGQLIESIRTVVEGEGSVDALDAYGKKSRAYGKRNAKRGSGAYSKKRAARMSRREARRKIKDGKPEMIRKSVLKGYVS